MSAPRDASCCPSASETVDTIVPMCAMLRRSLSSLAAASLATALTRAAAPGGSFVPSNHTVEFGAPPARRSSSRMTRADGIVKPIAALATVLARLIFARSNATSGMSSALVATANSAKRTARLTPVTRSDPSDELLTTERRQHQSRHFLVRARRGMKRRAGAGRHGAVDPAGVTVGAGAVAVAE